MKFSAILASGALVFILIMELQQATAKLIKSDCLIKSELYGAKQEGDIEFSDETQLTSEIESNMEFYAYRECNDSKG